jgi:hypothetical protein
MINIKSSLFYALIAGCLGTGYGAHYFVSQGDRVPHELRYAECEDSGKPKLDKTQRPLARGQGF